jgi:hypothetical protein
MGGNEPIVCACGQPFFMRESYEEHRKVCKEQVEKPEEVEVVTFDKRIWDRMIAGIKNIFELNMAAKRECPECHHKFVPEDEVTIETVQAYVGMFGDPSEEKKGD